MNLSRYYITEDVKCSLSFQLSDSETVCCPVVQHCHLKQAAAGVQIFFSFLFSTGDDKGKTTEVLRAAR